MPIISQTDLAHVIDLAERFAARELAPACLDADRYPFAPFPRSILNRAHETGLAGAALPEQYGGTALGYSALGAILRTLARTDASPAFLIMVQSLVREMAVHGFSDIESLKIAAIQNDDASELLAFPAFHNPEKPGSQVKAAETADGYRLTGTASNLVGLPVASGALVQADFGGKYLWAFIDLKNQSQNNGVLVKDPVVMLGLRACPVGDLELSGANVPPNGVFIESAGSAALAEIADRYRIMAANLSLGVLQGAYETAREYAKQRRQGKKRIIEHHMVGRMLARMNANIDLSRAALNHCAAAIDGEIASRPTEMASIRERVAAFAAEGTTDAVQVLGGYGYMHDYGQEKRMRDAKQLQAALSGQGETRAESCHITRAEP